MFTVRYPQHSKTRRSRGLALQTDKQYMFADHPLGPFRYITNHFLSGNKHGSLYSGKLIQDAYGQWQFLAFKNFSAQSDFIGELANPVPVHIVCDDRLELDLGERDD